MKPHKIIEQVFKEEFGDDWGNELRDFEHGFSDYYDCSIKAVKQALNIAAVINWVAIEDKLPPLGSWVLAYSPDSGRHIAWYEYQWADRAEYVIKNVTHWVNIPKPPCL